MSRLAIIGFETQIQGGLSFNGESQDGGTTVGPSGSPTIDTTNPGSGAACLSCAGSGVSAYVTLTIPSPTLGRHYYGRVRFRVSDATPTAAVRLWEHRTLAFYIQLNTNGTLTVHDAAGAQVGSASAAIADNTYYLLEVHWMTPSSGNGTLEVKLDGDLFVSSTNVSITNATIGATRIGHVNSSTTGCVVLIDDIGINDDQGSAQNSWLGEGKIILLKPIGDSARDAGWTTSEITGNTTDLWQAVDNTPPQGKADTTTDLAGTKVQIRNAVSTAVQNYDATLQSYTTGGVGADDTISVIQPIVRTGSNNATNTAGAIDLLSNPDQGAETAFSDFDNGIAGTDPTNWRPKRGVVLYAPTVTKGTSPVLRVGKRTATTRVALVDLMGLYVEYVPSAGESHSGTSAVTGGGATVGSVQKQGLASVPVAGGGTLTGSETKNANATTLVSGTGTATITATRQSATSASASGGGTIALAGTKKSTGAISVSGGGVIAVTVLRGHTTEADISGGGALLVEVSIARLGAPMLSGGGELSASGSSSTPEDVVVSGGGTPTSTGQKATSGDSAISGAGTPVASGDRATGDVVVISGNGASTLATLRTSASDIDCSGAGTVSHTAQKDTSNSVSMSAGGVITVSGTGTSDVESAVVITGGGAIVVATFSTKSGSAALSGSGTLATDGTKMGQIGVGVAGGGGVTVSTASSKSGALVISGAGQQSVSGVSDTPEDAILSGGGAIVVSSAIARFGAASVSGGGSLEGQGSSSGAASGAGAISGGGTTTVSGTKTVTRSATVSGKGAVAASTSKHSQKHIAVTGGGSITLGTTYQDPSHPALISSDGVISIGGTKLIPAQVEVGGDGSAVLTAAGNRQGDGVIAGSGVLAAIGVNAPLVSYSGRGEGSFANEDDAAYTGRGVASSNEDIDASYSGRIDD